MTTALDFPVDGLVSFHYFKRDEAIGPLAASGRYRLIGDSGAFSALTQGTPIKMAEYAAWCRRWSAHLYWMSTLDVIGDPAATLRNWRYMRDTHGLITVPTLHVGASPQWMDTYVKDGCDFFGLGGMVGRALQSFPWLVKVFRYARDHHPQARFHTWGLTHRKVLDNLPVYSADSSSIASGHSFARLRLFDPATANNVNVNMRRHDVYAAGRLLRDVYGVDPTTIVRPSPGNRALARRTNARAYQLYGEWLRRRHNVTAPIWGLDTTAGPPPGGPRLHVVDSPGDLRQLVDDEELIPSGR